MPLTASKFENVAEVNAVPLSETNMCGFKLSENVSTFKFFHLQRCDSFEKFLVICCKNQQE